MLVKERSGEATAMAPIKSQQEEKLLHFRSVQCSCGQVNHSDRTVGSLFQKSRDILVTSQSLDDIFARGWAIDNLFEGLIIKNTTTSIPCIGDRSKKGDCCEECGQ